LRNPRKTPRLAAALAIAVGMLLAFAALGGVGLAQTSGGGPGKGQYGKKVTICHKGKKTIRISKAALAKHLRHGDTLGRCDRSAKKGRKHDGHKGRKGDKGDKGAEHKGSKGDHPGKGKRGGKG
jgi:long-subunit fatty acid transport protein